MIIIGYIIGTMKNNFKLMIPISANYIKNTNNLQFKISDELFRFKHNFKIHNFLILVLNQENKVLKRNFEIQILFYL